MRVRTFLFGAAVGAAVAYLADPVTGRGRRTRLRDQAMAQIRDARERAERRARYARNVAEGRRAEMRSPGPDDANPDDGKLEARIRSTVFGDPGIPGSLTLELTDGVVTLRGEVDTPEALETVPGVLGVEAYLHLPGQEPPNKASAIEASRRAARTTARVATATEHVGATQTGTDLESHKRPSLPDAPPRG